METFAVNAYGVYANITFPLIFKVFKPKGTLKESDKYKTKIELASEIITELMESGLNIELVLADSLYGEQRVAGVPPVVATGEPEGWEIIFSVYTIISLNSPVFLGFNQSRQLETEAQENSAVDFSNHPLWNHESGWKNTLNNLRLIIQPPLLFWLIYPWLSIFPNSDLLLGFNHLIAAMNQFKPCYASG